VTGWDDIIGREPVRSLLRLLTSGRVPQALVFQGPEGMGKATVARLFAAALIADAVPGGEGEDAVALRLVLAGNHPDLLTVERQPRPGSRELRAVITVDQIRQMTHLAALAPREGRRRLFVVDPADRMNAEAQNALLKTLEEPAERAVIVLVASRPHLLLPTVRSRCFIVRFPALRTAELAALLRDRGFDEGEAVTRSALAAGCPGRALTLDLEVFAARREGVLEALETAAGGGRGLGRIPSLGAALAGKDAAVLQESLDLLQGLLRDAARASVDPDDTGVVHADLTRRLGALGDRLGSARTARLVESVDGLRGELRYNINRTLVTESLLAAVAGGPFPDRRRP
jgi:DNA polymerase-3 subunit delta'